MSICGNCKNDRKVDCARCDGTGKIGSIDLISDTRRTCPTCNGGGTVECPECR